MVEVPNTDLEKSLVSRFELAKGLNLKIGESWRKNIL